MKHIERKNWRLWGLLLGLALVVMAGLLLALLPGTAQAVEYSNTEWDGSFTSGNTVTITGTVTLTETVTVGAEDTLNIAGDGTLIRGDGCTGSMFDVNGGTLIINNVQRWKPKRIRRRHRCERRNAANDRCHCPKLCIL